MSTSIKSRSVSSMKGDSSAMPSKTSDTSDDFNGKGEDNINPLERSSLVDENSPVDRRVLNEVFQTIFCRYNIDQTKLAESCGVSTTTISTIVNKGELVTWATWQSIISGLIKFKLSHAYAFWVGLPPCLREKIRDNTGNPVILQYIAEYDKLVVQNEESVISNINLLLQHVDPKRIDEDFLSKITLPNSKKSKGTFSSSPLSEASFGPHQVSSDNVNFYSHGGVGNMVLIVLPNSADLSSTQTLDFVTGAIKSASAIKETVDNPN